MYYKEWYEQNYHELSGHGLWLRGEELNRLPAAEFESRSYRVLFARLSSYFDTAESTSHQLLYQVAAEIPSVFPDLSFLPLKSDAAIFERGEVPWLLGSGSKAGVEEFDLLGFSLSIVQELVNIPTALHKSNIPLRRKDRLSRPDLPLVILGGASALFSGIYWHDESPLDAIYVGEELSEIKKLLELEIRARRAGLDKAARLSEMSKLDGIIIPGNARSTRKVFTKKLDCSETPAVYPSSYLESEIGTVRLPISEGCPCFCSFCAESWDRKPYRERSLEKLLSLTQEMKQRMAAETIELFSFNFNLHSQIYPLLFELAPRFLNVGLKSQRLDVIAEDPEILSALRLLNKSSITIGIEGVSERIRAFLHKSLTSQQILRGFEVLFPARPRELKIFLIITGRENENDVSEFAALLSEIKKRKGGTGSRLIFSATPLVRFPWTPLEFDDGAEPQVYERIIKQVKHQVTLAGFEFRASAETSEYFVSQTLTRPSGPSVAAALLSAIEKTGFVYYRAISPEFESCFRRELLSAGVTEPLKGVSPARRKEYVWSSIETGVDQEFLIRSYEEACSFKDQGYCLGRAWAKTRCLGCNACEDAETRKTLLGHEQKRGAQWRELGETLQSARRGAIEQNFEVAWLPRVRGVPSRMAGVALAQAVLWACPELTETYLGVGTSARLSTWVYGRDRTSLRFKAGAAALLEGLVEKAALINAQLAPWGEVLSIGRSVAEPTFCFRIVSSYKFNPQRYLLSKGLKHTSKRNEGGGFDFVFTKDALKKGLVISLSSFESGAKFGAELVPGPKLDLEAFVQNSFSLQTPKAWVRCEIEARC